MSTTVQQFELPPAVRGTLNAVRRRLRAYVWVEGLALLFILLGAAFWIGLLWDWWFEPSPAARRVAMGIVAVAGLYVCYRYLLRRAFVPISNATAAILLERRFKALGDHVITAVHVAESPGRAAAYNSDLVARTQAAASSAVAGIDGGKLFHRAPMMRAVLGALAAAASVALFAVFAGDAFGFWMKRIALANDPWPRRVNLEVVGFPADEAGQRAERLAEEDDYELLVRARLDGYEAPRMVEIRTQTADGRRDRETLIRVGQAVPGRDEFQLYRHEFKRVTADVSFDVVGGDDRVRDLTLAVVKRPELFSLELASEYPAYLKRSPRRLAVTGGMRIPEGTRLVLHANATKPLIASRIHTAQRTQDTELSFANKPTSTLSWEYGPLADDEVLLVSVTDTDGVTSREPYRVSLAVVPDELPQVAVRLRGIGTAITPDARIPMAGKITDEYGLNQVWIEFQVDGEPPLRRPFAKQPGGVSSVTEIDVFDTRSIDPITGVRSLTLVPGQRLSLAIKANDQFNLSPEPRTGSSPMFTLDVVTMAELLALLERRELELRQRYEAIYEKVTDTRNLLSRIDFNNAASGDGGASQNGVDGKQDPAPQVATDQDGSLGETAPQGADSEAQRALARRRLRVAGALQNITQSADEILGVAEAFDEIHEQLTNNRIDNSDLKARLREQIAEPLRHIVEIRMPQLTAQVQLIEANVENAAAGPAAVEGAVALADAILVEMHQVLERMLELETYNEVVGQLRDIINDQEEINRRTKERQRERLRGIFEDDK